MLAFAIVWVMGATSVWDNWIPVRTDADRRIDSEIGDGNGYVDPQEAEVARAAHLVYRATGIDVRPKITWLTNRTAGLATEDAAGPRILINRGEAVDTVQWVVFHEAGHVACGHTKATGKSPMRVELEAMAYTGALVAKIGADIRTALKDVASPNRDSPIHGTREQRAAAMWIGYVAAGGTWRPPGYASEGRFRPVHLARRRRS
jgi:hypothetical protein